MDFTGRHVIVTGAGKGIGRSLVEMLTRRGARVTALSRTQADLDELAASSGCEGIAVDLADPDATRAAVKRALPADFLVNNAGTTELDSFLDLPVETFDHIYAVNTRAPMIVAQEYARDVVRRGARGAIVNISSLSSFLGLPDHAAYCASKGALDAMGRVMANELGRLGIRPSVALGMARSAISEWQGGIALAHALGDATILSESFRRMEHILLTPPRG